MTALPMPSGEVLQRLRQGGVIPAHPLALTSQRRMDERRQRALTRYYMAAGADGVAVGVHTTQFEIRGPKAGLYRPVLELAAETIDAEYPANRPPFLRIAGICGRTAQAVQEARTAADLGYHAGLVALGSLAEASLAALIRHLRAVGEVIPIMGFYLPPAAGGRLLPLEFWRKFVEMENAVAITIAALNRYQTLDIVRAVAESGREGEIALYTGNDDNILLDLLTPFCFSQGKQARPVRIVGGVLAHWAVWTRRAVSQFGECRRVAAPQRAPVSHSLLEMANQVTDSNAALSDAANGYAGSIPGILEVLRRQGLLEGCWCLDPKQTLSPRQSEEIDRVHAAYPHLNDDQFVARYLDDWLR